MNMERAFIRGAHIWGAYILAGLISGGRISCVAYILAGLISGGLISCVAYNRMYVFV